MTDRIAFQAIASLRPGMRVADARVRLQAAGTNGGSKDLPWHVGAQDERVFAIEYRSDFPDDIPILGLKMGENFRAISRLFKNARTIPGWRSTSGRSRYHIPCLNDGLELLIDLGDRNQIVQITMLRYGWLRDTYPDIWQATNALAEQIAARRTKERLQAAENQARHDHQRAVATQLSMLTDPEERLDYWAANTLLWGKAAPQLVRYADWLKQGDPDRWHDAALQWNWDQGTIPLHWIVSRPDCDAATALAIFYLGEPFDQPDDSDDGALLDFIRKRWEGIGYPSHGIRFDPPAYVATSVSDDDLRRVPPSMRLALPGRMVATLPYHDGIPITLIQTPS
ncbi:protein of unknown function [Sphingobium sp. AP50]|nr:protein of unknown function [Sphingobium sp. AP50]